MYLRPSFFKVVMKIAQEVCKTRMFLDKPQFEFYEELYENYKSVESEIVVLNPKPNQQLNNRKMEEMIKS